jgi:hypothetical protein
MAKPYRKPGRWYARVKDGVGAWRSVALPEAPRCASSTMRSGGGCVGARPRGIVSGYTQKKLRLHDTRHTTTTLLLAAGADPWGVSKMLGHPDASITSRVYGHLVLGYLKAQADRITGLFAADGFATPLLPAAQNAPEAPSWR